MFTFCYRLTRRCAEWTAERRARCDRWRTEWRQRCARWESVATRRCDRWRTEQQRRCDRWRQTAENRCDRWEQQQRNRCDSWGIFSFVCLIWTTVTSWVCRAWVVVVSTVCDLWVTITSTVCDLWTTVVSFFCRAWEWVGSLVCDLWTFVTTFVCRLWEWIVESICSIFCLLSRLAAPTEYSKPMLECIYGWTARYRIEHDTATCSVRIVLRIRLVPAAGVSDDDLAVVRARWEPAIEDAWTNRFPLTLTDGKCRCRRVNVTTVDVQFVATNEHHVVNVQAGSGRADMNNWFVNSTGGTAAHEAGHMFANPDEYADPACPLRTVTSDGSIMQNSQTGVVRERHYDDFARWLSNRTCCHYDVGTADGEDLR